jgi:2,3-bisphosphoglycerate-independent phosphoglycerate mutase
LTRPFRKSVILILDGLGDLPSPALGGRTPLEAACTPVMNRLAGSGYHGLVDPEQRGKVANTHTGCGTLLGVLPEVLSRLKRGPVEASGAGRTLKPGEIAVRANFATLQEAAGGSLVVDRRAGRICTGTLELAATLSDVDLGDGISGGLLSTDQHRCVLVLSGPGLDPRVSDTDPGDHGMPGFVRTCVARDAAADLTAEKINRFVEIARHRLSGHPVNLARIEAGLPPANGVITRSAGAALALENRVKDLGIRAALVAGCNTVIGLARALDFKVVSEPGFTADAETDLPGKMHAALQALELHDLVYIHIKAPDIFAHDHQPEGKSAFLERVDAALGMLEKAGMIIAISADHSTDSNSGAHTADPVPALLFDPCGAPEVEALQLNFGETACAAGNMPRQTGHAFLLRVLDLMNSRQLTPGQAKDTPRRR